MPRFAKTQLLLFFVLALQAQAIRFSSTNTYTVAAGEAVKDELWIQTIDAEVNGLVKDDLFLLAENRMVLAGEFEHNVWGVGNNIDLTGNARRNVRLAGRTIQIEGRIGGNIQALGDTLKVASNAVVNGHVQLFGTSVILEGNPCSNVSITAARSATISGTIGGNLNIVAPEIILQRDTRIAGDLVYTSSKELVPAEGIVAGKLIRTIPPPPPSISKTRLLSRLTWLLAAVLAGLPLIALFPITTAITSQLIRKAPFKCLWVGALCILGLPMLALMCLYSIIGLPLGALILGGWGFMAYTSHIAVGLAIGMLVLRKSNTSFGHILLSLVIGLGVIHAAAIIPSIGNSVWIVVMSIGSGGLLLGLIQKRQMIVQMPKELRKLEELQKQDYTENQEEK